MPIKVTYQNPGLEYDENMVCEDFLNMGMLPLEYPLELYSPPIVHRTIIFFNYSHIFHNPDKTSKTDGYPPFKPINHGIFHTFHGSARPLW